MLCIEVTTMHKGRTTGVQTTAVAPPEGGGVQARGAYPGAALTSRGAGPQQPWGPAHSPPSPPLCRCCTPRLLCGRSWCRFPTPRDKCSSPFLIPSPKVPGKDSYGLCLGQALNSGAATVPRRWDAMIRHLWKPHGESAEKLIFLKKGSGEP